MTALKVEWAMWQADKFSVSKTSSWLLSFVSFCASEGLRDILIRFSEEINGQVNKELMSD